MRWAELKAGLRREVLSPGFEPVFAAHAPELHALAGIDGPRALLAALDEATPFQSAHDGLLGDLLRLGRRCPHSAVRSAVLYATQSQWPRLYRCIAAAVGDVTERLLLVVAAVLEQAARFDPDRRSVYVLAGLANDARSRLGVLRQREMRQVLAVSDPLEGALAEDPSGTWDYSGEEAGEGVVPGALRVPAAELLVEAREAREGAGVARKGRRGASSGRRSILRAVGSAEVP